MSLQMHSIRADAQDDAQKVDNMLLQQCAWMPNAWQVPATARLLYPGMWQDYFQACGTTIVIYRSQISALDTDSLEYM